MQSLSRAIRRRQAAIVWDSVMKRQEIYWRRGCDRRVWAWAVRNRMSETEFQYCEGVTKPITKRGNKRDFMAVEYEKEKEI
jgi:hypothetical protein